MILSKMINLFNKTDDFIKSINSLSKTDDFIKNISLLVKQVLAGPDMTEVRVLIQFRTFRFHKWLFKVISK